MCPNDTTPLTKFALRLMVSNMSIIIRALIQIFCSSIGVAVGMTLLPLSPAYPYARSISGICAGMSGSIFSTLVYMVASGRISSAGLLTFAPAGMLAAAHGSTAFTVLTMGVISLTLGLLSRIIRNALLRKRFQPTNDPLGQSHGRERSMPHDEAMNSHG